jgi:membrane-bound serine protease (ClpP class)
MIPRYLRWHRVLLAPCLLGLIALVCMCMVSQVEAATPHVDVMVLNGNIDPAALNYLTNAIAAAEHDGAQALVIEVDTPGGDMNSMTAMTKAELASSVPIITYVYPSGGTYSGDGTGDAHRGGKSRNGYRWRYW